MPENEQQDSRADQLRRRKRKRKALLSRIKADPRGEDALLGIALRQGVLTKSFNDLLADILITYQERMQFTARREAEEEPSSILRRKGILGAAKKLSPLNSFAGSSFRLLSEQARQLLSIAELEQNLRRMRPYSRERSWWLAGLLLSLSALYRCLIDPNRTSWNEYLRYTLPDILTVSQMPLPPGRNRKTPWSSTAISRHLKRSGGIKAAELMAVYLMSSDPHLRRFRPPFEIRWFRSRHAPKPIPVIEMLRTTRRSKDTSTSSLEHGEEIESALQGTGRTQFRSLPPGL
jgi:hypothetical protein